MDVKCPPFATLGSLVDGEQVSPEVGEHVAACARCGKTVAALRSLDHLLSPVGEIVGEIELPAELQGRLRAIADQAPPPARGTLRRIAPLAAAAVIVLIAGLYGLMDTTPVPPGHLEPEPPAPGPLALRDRVRDALGSGPEEGRELLTELDGARMVILLRIALEDDPVAGRAALLALAESGPREALWAALRAVELPDRTVAAVELLAAIGDRKALPALEVLLRDANHPLQVIGALEAIGGEEAARILDRGLIALGSSPLREAAVMAIARADGLVGAGLLLSRHGDPEFSPYVLAAIEANADTLVPHLLRLAEQGENRAFDLLGTLARPEAVPGLARLLEHRSLRGEAARILALTDTTAAADALIGHWQHPEVRAAFAHAGTATEFRLISLLDAGQNVNQRRAIELLAICGGPRAIRALLPFARNRALAPAIVLTLGEIGGPDAVAALDLLAEIPHLRREAIRAMGATGEESAVLVLISRGLEHRTLRGEAVAALGRIDSQAAVRGILTLEPDRRPKSATVRTLNSMDRGVVVPALSSLLTGDLGPAAKSALHALGGGPSAPRVTGNY